MKKVFFTVFVLVFSVNMIWSQTKEHEALSIVKLLINSIDKPVPQGTTYSQESGFFYNMAQYDGADIDSAIYGYRADRNGKVIQAVFSVGYNRSTTALASALYWVMTFSSEKDVTKFPGSSNLFVYNGFIVKISIDDELFVMISAQR